MFDLGASARRLYRRWLGPRPGDEAPEIGKAAEADGRSATAAVEASIGDGRVEDHSLFQSHNLAMALGLAASGRRATAFLSDSELMASLDLLTQAARRRLPLVVHLTASDGHEAYHAAAATGAVLFFATHVQDTADLTLLARRLAEDALVPVVVAMDRSETAHSVQNLRLPAASAMERFLGRPGDPVHPPTPSQEMLFGKHRRRVPRWHDPERPLLCGADLGREAFALAGAARHAFFDVDLPELLAQGCAAFEQEIGRLSPVLRARHVRGARSGGRKQILLVAQGAALETAEAVAAALSSDGIAVGVVGLRVLRPFPASALAELLAGRQGVLVLERTDAPLLAEAPLLREIRSLMSETKGPPPASALYGLGGFPLRAADLAAAVRELAERDAPWPSPVYLGLDTATTDGGAYPKLQAMQDRLRRDYPALTRLGIRGDAVHEDGGSDLLPSDALTVTVHRVTDDDSFSREAAVLLRRVIGGDLWTRPALGRGRWGAERVDRIVRAVSPFKDPDDVVASDVAVCLGDGCWTGALRRVKDGGAVLLAGASAPGGSRQVDERGIRVYSISAQDPERLLGALFGLLETEGLPGVSLHQLLKSRRRMLAENGGGKLEPGLDDLQWGFEHVSRLQALDDVEILEDAGALTEDGPSPAVRRLGRSSVPLSDVPGFWDRVGVLYRDGEASALLPDPFLATGTVPPFSSALRDLTPARAALPVFDPALCTGCGACWSVCPDNAVGPAVIGPSELLDFGMERARRNGHSVDKLRMVTSKLATQVLKTRTSDDWQGGPAGPLFDAAFEAVVGRMKLPEGRKEDLREAYGPVRAEIADLPVARTGVFFDQAPEKHGKLFSLALDPEACKGCGLCVAACEDEALTAVSRDAVSRDAGTEAVDARALWRLCEELPEPDDAVLEQARNHPDAGPLAGALLSREARDVMAGGHGAEPGSGTALALRQGLGAAAFHLRPARRRQLEEIESLQTRLGEAIHEGLSQALPDRDLDALARGLDTLHQPDADLADLTARVETAFENERVDVERTRRLVDAARLVANLARRFETGRAPLSLALAGEELTWAAAFPRNPFRIPVTIDATGDAADLARGLLEGERRETVDIVRVLRRARLELDRPQEAARAVEALEGLTWSDLHDDERRYCPPLFLAITEQVYANQTLAALRALCEADLPIKIFLLSDSATEDCMTAQDRPATEDRWSSTHCYLLSDPAETLFAQSSVAHFSHLEQAVARALDHEGPAVLRILAPSPAQQGFAGHETLERTRAHVESGAFPLLDAGTSDTYAGQVPPAGSAVGRVPPAGPTPDVKALEQRHAAEIAALRHEYETRLASERARYQAEAIQRVRARLIQLATPASASPSQETPA